jgi:hypothetical protein
VVGCAVGAAGVALQAINSRETMKMIPNVRAERGMIFSPLGVLEMNMGLTQNANLLMLYALS